MRLIHRLYHSAETHWLFFSFFFFLTIDALAIDPIVLRNEFARKIIKRLFDINRIVLNRNTDNLAQ